MERDIQRESHKGQKETIEIETERERRMETGRDTKDKDIKDGERD